MNNFTTLNAITEDLLLTIRGSEVVRTEPISKIQLEAWVHQYRAILIKRDLDKGRLINPDFVQTISGLELEGIGTGIYRTAVDVPKTIFRNSEDGFTWIGSSTEEYQYMTNLRSKWQPYRKYTSEDPFVYLEDNKLTTNTQPSSLVIRGVFENPMEVMILNDASADADSVYPIPVVLLPVLKEMILKGELGIESAAASDETNNGKHDIK